jgi:hypothetical protein
MLKWLVRIIIIAIVLTLLAAFTVQMVLWSDWPRQRIVRELQQQTGLSVEINKVRAGWGGNTQLIDMHIGTPLESDPIVAIATDLRKQTGDSVHHCARWRGGGRCAHRSGG